MTNVSASLQHVMACKPKTSPKPMHLVVAAACVFLALSLVFELIWLPIPSELSSVPDVQKLAPRTLVLVVATVATFALPAYSAFRVLMDKKQQQLQQCWGVPVLATSIVAAAAWEYAAVKTLWKHKSLLQSQQQLCTEGPYALSRHPINFGLGWAAVSFFMAAGNNPLQCVAGAFFIEHIFRKTQEEEAWLATHYETGWAEYTRQVPALLAPAWLFAIVLLPLIVSGISINQQAILERLHRWIGGVSNL